MNNNYIFYTDFLRDLVTVDYSAKSSRTYALEQQAWINFIDFLDECEG